MVSNIEVAQNFKVLTNAIQKKKSRTGIILAGPCYNQNLA
jgi:hypothetical protein